jgi:hypothetical protein
MKQRARQYTKKVNRRGPKVITWGIHHPSVLLQTFYKTFSNLSPRYNETNEKILKDISHI